MALSILTTGQWAWPSLLNVSVWMITEPRSGTPTWTWTRQESRLLYCLYISLSGDSNAISQSPTWPGQAFLTRFETKRYETKWPRTSLHKIMIINININLRASRAEDGMCAPSLPGLAVPFHPARCLGVGLGLVLGVGFLNSWFQNWPKN